MGSATKDLVQWPVTLGVLAVLATVAHSASFGASLSRELNYNSIPGGDNDESNMVEPAPFASLSDFLSSKQGVKKTDDASRMKALVKALYALDALDKKMAEKDDVETLEQEPDAELEMLGESNGASASTTVESTSTTAASTTTAAPAPSTPAYEPTTEAATEVATGAAAPATTPAPSLVHDSEVNEFVDEIAKHISTFFQGILHYFDGPGLPANATVVIELEEKSDDSSADSGESSESDSKEEISTEEVPKWLVQMFESVAALPHGDAEDRSKEFRPKEPLQSEER